MNITHYITKEKEYQQVLKELDNQKKAKKKLPLQIAGLSEGARAAFLCEIIESERKSTTLPVAIAVSDEKEANKLKASLENAGLYTPIYPVREMIFYNITASHDFEHERLEVLCSLRNNNCDAVIFTPDAAMQYTIPVNKLDESVKILRVDETHNQKELCRFLSKAGYQSTQLISGVGQFSLRGGILDFFPPSSQYPVRLDFFDDVIERISSFDLISQRRFEELDLCAITPARELPLTDDDKTNLQKLISGELAKAKTTKSHEILERELSVINAGMNIEFADKYINFIYSEQTTLFDYIPDDSIFVTIEKNSIAERLKAYQFRLTQTAEQLCEEGLQSKYSLIGRKPDDFKSLASNHVHIYMDNFITGSKDIKLAGIYTFMTRQTPSYTDKLPLLFEDLMNLLKSDYKVYILCENDLSKKQIVEYLDNNNITAYTDNPPAEGHPCVVSGIEIFPFELPLTRFSVLSLYPSISRTMNGSIKKTGKRKKKKSAEETIMSYADLTVDDYVVHETHGIGQYKGLSPLTINGVRKDFVKIQYAGKDVLYLPCDQLDSITKYIGAKAEDGTLKLSKMGSKTWESKKTKATQAAKDMAKELISLYAQRLRRKGHAFPKDDDFQRIFEESFEYDETEDQLQSANEIKSDMEKPYPMDRLLCGDVGFGKTEVALRAAFKAASTGKQVAILVPTTILALQHYQTVTSRMRNFPIHVDMISRFSSEKEAALSLRKLKRGETDIMIGTHRLISKDIEFKDLGLLIIDEEQRFGVAQKEKLKQISDNIDVLTLTATPIPRTLNMAMSGIRDMSILEEAPADRFPVQTYVLEYDEAVIQDAINSELRRGGQVFYMYNRIEGIYHVADRLAALNPDARIAVAHGRMDKKELSEIWESMISGEIDILVSTTIIETGIDIQNANTMIIENADKIGLAQLHQLRGRIGRSNKRAYAYFTYRKGKVLSEISEKRLTAIRDYTEFGSGFKIALRDLEIRGAGNLLGAEQHGHIESVGYDLYMKILNRAILDEKGDKFEAKTECTIDFNVNAYIPEDFIESEPQRIDIYKKIALIESEEDLNDVRDEILDRYGDMPKSVANLLDISLLRSLGEDLKIKKIQKANKVVFSPEDPAKINYSAWIQAAMDTGIKILVEPGLLGTISMSIKNIKNPLRIAQGLLLKVLEIQNKENENQNNTKNQKKESEN